MTRTYRNQFPDFELGVTIPDSFADTSWCNDVCPSFTEAQPDGSNLILWVHFQDPAERELGTEQRFELVLANGDSDFIANLAYSDDLDEVLAFARAWREGL